MNQKQGLAFYSFLWTKRVLVTTVWISAAIFGLYILAFYADAVTDNELSRWNEGLPDLYDPEEPVATAGIGIHFAMGGIILILGSIQLIRPLRKRFPIVHRWIGRVYVLASILTAVGGLFFILFNGTIGGLGMDIGFALYGVLMLLSAVQTVRHARAGKIETHELWALRLYALAIASWLYRMEYGFWFAITGGIGHTSDFSGWFDYFMDYFFYLPNLLLVEWLVRAKKSSSAWVLWTSSAVFILATLFVILATHTFIQIMWAEPILELF